MKKYLSFFLLLTIAMTSLHAQQKNERNRARISPKKVNTKERAKLHTERLSNYLELDEKQAAQVQAINEKYIEHSKTLRQDENIADQDKTAQIHDLTIKKNEEIKSVLNKKQIEKYEGRKQSTKPQKGEKERKEYNKNTDNNKGESKARPQQRNRGERMSVEQVASRKTNAMTEGLKLNKKQIANVKSINLQYAKEREALRMQKLAPKQKSMALRSLTAKQDAELQNVLSKKQFAQYLEERETFKRKGVSDRPVPERMKEGKRQH